MKRTGKVVQKKNFIFILCLLAGILSIRQTEAAVSLNSSSNGEIEILFWEQTLENVYSTRDVTYPKKAKGFNSAGVYEKRKKVIKDGANTFCTLKNGLLEVKSQVWKEAAPSPFYAYYHNTTEFYWEVPNGDYDVEVILANPTLKTYSAFLGSDTQTQSQTQKVTPGSEEILKGRISVVNKELALDILAFSEAKSEKSAGLNSVYIKGIKIKKVAKEEKGKIPTLFIAGDSTSAYYSTRKAPWEGWGQELYQYFKNKNTVRQKSYEELGFNTDYLNGYREYKMKDIIIENWSVPGESTRTFLESGKWDGILNKARPGDYVFIQFGHNDSVKSKGIKYTSISDYKKNLNTFVKGCKQRGVQCVFLSPIPKCVFSSKGVCSPWVNHYRTAMKSIASTNQIPFLDIGSYGADFLTNIGKENAKSYYMILKKGKYSYFSQGKNDTIHLQKKGAVKFAQIVAARIVKEKKLKGLASYLKVDTNYYSGITKTLRFSSIKKSGKKTWHFTWKKVRYAKYYKIYVYNNKKKTYQYIAKRYGTKAKIKGYSTKKKNKFRVKAIF